MSRSKRKPYSYYVVVNRGNTKAKRLHHHKLRLRRKAFLAALKDDEYSSAPDLGIKKIDGLDIYDFPSDGGNYWMGDLKHTWPDLYRKVIRK